MRPQVRTSKSICIYLLFSLPYLFGYIGISNSIPHGKEPTPNSHLPAELLPFNYVNRTRGQLAAFTRLATVASLSCTTFFVSSFFFFTRLPFLFTIFLSFYSRFFIMHNVLLHVCGPVIPADRATPTNNLEASLQNYARKHQNRTAYFLFS